MAGSVHMTIVAPDMLSDMTRLVGTGPAVGTAAVSMTTERLTIGSPAERDAAALFAMTYEQGGLPVTSKLLWNGPIDLDETRAWCAKYRDNDFYDGGHHWVIGDRPHPMKAPPLVMGAIGLTPGNQPGSAHLGYWLGEAYWSKGFMTEAVVAICSHAFEVLNLHRIEASAFLTNPASSAVLKKAGFASEGVRRACAYKYGEWIDELVWARLRTDR